MDQIRFLPGVGEVSLTGFPARNLRVWVDTNKLSANYLTLTDVINALNTQHLESATGQFTEGARELRVRWLGEAGTVEEVGNIQILNRGGQRFKTKSSVLAMSPKSKMDYQMYVVLQRKWATSCRDLCKKTTWHQ